MLDASAFIGEWAFRRLSHTTVETLEARLRQEGIEAALVSPLEGLLHADPQPANASWGERLRGFPFFRFAPLLDPTLPNRERSFNACRDDGAAAVRLVPNYHRYFLADERVGGLVRAAGESRLPVIVQLRMQDVRSMHPLAQTPDVPRQEAPDLARRHPETTFILSACNWSEANAFGPQLRDIPNLFLTTTHMEWVDGLRQFLDRWGADRLLFGTHAPLLTPTAARLKIETARLSDGERNAILRENAERLLR